MKYIDRGAAIVVLILFFLISALISTKAQNVKLEGNVFVQQQTATGDSTATGYYYQDRNGVKYPIFLSPHGKAYAWVWSKEKRDDKGNLLKPAHRYKKYLPKITQQLCHDNNKTSNQGNK